VVAHDKINRFLTRQSLTPETLWNEVERYVEKEVEWLVNPWRYRLSTKSIQGLDSSP